MYVSKYANFHSQIYEKNIITHYPRCYHNVTAVRADWLGQVRHYVTHLTDGNVTRYCFSDDSVTCGYKRTFSHAVMSTVLHVAMR